MSLACESEIRVQNENALRFSLVSRPLPLLEYIKAISSLVGASHILAVFEEIDNLKVFFDDKRYVDTLIRSGVHVMGRHVRVDYVIPPGVKVILSNVDPVLPNHDITRLLTSYGTVVSPVIRPPICDDAELCHIGYGVRYAYMIVEESLPTKVEFKFGDQLCAIRIRVEDKPESFTVPYIKEEIGESSGEGESNPPTVSPCPGLDCHAIAGPSGIDTNSNDTIISEPVVVRVEGAASTIIPQIEYSTSLKRGTIHMEKHSKGRPGRPKSVRKLMRKRKNVTATARAAKRIKENFKHKYLAGKRCYKKHPKAERVSVIESAAPIVISPSSSVSTEPIDIESTTLISEVDGQESIDNPTISVLEPQKLLMYLDEVKHQRAPLELAKKYLGEECDKDKISNFIQQLQQYNRSHNDPNLKWRILRIIRIIRDSI